MLQLDLTQLSSATTLSSGLDASGHPYLVVFTSRFGLRFYCVQCDATEPRKLPRLSVPTLLVPAQYADHKTLQIVM